MKTFTITIKGQQDHITQKNKSESFISESKAREFLLGQLESLNYWQDEPVTLNDGDYYDTGDYMVTVEVEADFADKKIEVRVKNHPEQTVILTNQEWLNSSDVNDKFAKQLIDNKMQSDIIRIICRNRTVGCNYKYNAVELSDGVYELQ